MWHLTQIKCCPIGNMFSKIGERVALSYIVDFLLLQSFDCSIYFSIKTSWQKIFFSVPTGEYECHKGLCTKKLSSVQTFCHWSNASQPNLKGNQLLWDHILLFKPWNMIWEKNAQIFNQLDLGFQECFFLLSSKLECLGGLPDIKLSQQLTFGVHPDFFYCHLPG